MHWTSKLDKTRPVFGIHGGGCIGLGLMAYIASQSRSTNPYQIIATSNDEQFNEIINGTNMFYIGHVGTTERSCVKNICMISRNPENIIQLYVQANVLSICLTPGAFSESVKEIVSGLMQRYKTRKQSLNILILMNQPDACQYVRELIIREMQKLVNANVMEEILSQVTFIHTIPDRIVRKTPKNELIHSEDRMPSLFQAEKYFQFYVPKSYFSDLSHFPDITFVEDIVRIETIKNKYINGPHTILAWLGKLLGCKTIHESINYPGMKYFIISLMSEIEMILKMNFPELNRSAILSDIQKVFLKRCEDSIEDGVTRVGRNPLSKLDRFGRVIGTITLRQGHYRSALPYLEMGIAAGVLYAIQNPAEQGCDQIISLYQPSRSYEAILCYQNKEHHGLNASKDQALIKRVINNINLLSNSPKKFMNLEQMIWQLRQGFFMTRDNHLKKQALQLFLDRVNIKINFETGQIAYSNQFTPPKLDCELCLIRHGETFGNAGFATNTGGIDNAAVQSGRRSFERRIFQGNIDEPINQLTPQGKKQAEFAAKELWAQQWIPDIIFHSPLTRAKETGEPFVRILQANNIIIDYVELSQIREMSFGKWELARVCDIPPEENCHQFYKSQNALFKEDGVNIQGQFIEAENFCEVLMRAAQVLEELSKLYAGKKVLLNTHSMFGMACVILLGKGKQFANQDYLAFDGKQANGESYTLPHTTPVFLSKLTTQELPLIPLSTKRI